MQNSIYLAFVDLYLAQKPDIYRCICSGQNRLGFMRRNADYFWDSVSWTFIYPNLQARLTLEDWYSSWDSILKTKVEKHK